MPIITLVTGYVYLVFGSFKLFDSLGFEFISSCLSTSFLTIIMMCHVWNIAKSLVGNLVCPRTFALQMVLTHFSMIVVIGAIVALEWIPQSLIIKIVSLFLFAFFGYLLNIGAGTFPVFSVADPFYWNRNPSVSPSYDRAFKSILLALISYSLANLSHFWHSVATSCFIFIDVILMAHHWEIAGLDDWEEPVHAQRVINVPEDPVVEDLHMD